MFSEEKPKGLFVLNTLFTFQLLLPLLLDNLFPSFHFVALLWSIQPCLQRMQAVRGGCNMQKFRKQKFAVFPNSFFASRSRLFRSGSLINLLLFA